jgi:hypothetical protein
MSDFKPGDVIYVRVGGRRYKTIIDAHGVQRFKENGLLRHLVDTKVIDLNKLAVTYMMGKPFSRRHYAEFMMSIGYSVCGFAELSNFQGMAIENPLWAKESK